MKKILTLTLAALIALLAGCSHVAQRDLNHAVEVADKEYYKQLQGQNVSLNVYNWGEYLPDGSEEGMLDANKEFEDLTGIKVNYSTYATNEEMYAKLKGGGSSYDIIVPSDYMISRMIKEDMLEPLDMKNIPNFSNIMDKFKDNEYDPGSKYSIPYLWGTTGIIYDKRVVKEKDIDWDILWNEKYAGNILMFDNPRDAFSIAETMLGYSMNTEDSAELKAAAEKLKEQKSLVQAYVMDEVMDKMAAGEAAVASYYAGDALTLMREYDHIGFAIPKSGTNVFVDAVCIPKGCRNKLAAEMYINFLCERDVAFAIADFIDYSTPNQAAYDLIDNETKNDGISYPDDDYIKNHTTVFRNLSDEANLEMQSLWTEIKSSK